MENVKVFRMNECEWYASKWDLKETNDWYEKNIAENDIDEVEEMDLELEGMWVETTDKKDIERLGDKEIVTRHDLAKDNYKLGDLLRVGDSIFKFISYKEAIEKDIAGYGVDFEEPYLIASNE